LSKKSLVHLIENTVIGHHKDQSLMYFWEWSCDVHKILHTMRGRMWSYWC